MVSLNLTLNSSATSEIDKTAQISKSRDITILPWFLDWAENTFMFCMNIVQKLNTLLEVQILS